MKPEPPVPWLTVLRILQSDLQKCDRDLRPGATDALIVELRYKAAEAQLFIADEYVEFLRVTNDFGWNGLDIYGYDPSDEFVTANDIFAVNAGVGFASPTRFMATMKAITSCIQHRMENSE